MAIRSRLSAENVVDRLGKVLYDLQKIKSRRVSRGKLGKRSASKLQAKCVRTGPKSKVPES